MATRRKRKKVPKNCNPSLGVRIAGSELKRKHTTRAGRHLSTEGKAEKRVRLKRGCTHGLEGPGYVRRKKKRSTRRKRGSLNGPAGTFQLTDRQRCKLPIQLQRAIIRHHASQGKKILGLDRKPNCKNL